MAAATLGSPHRLACLGVPDARTRAQIQAEFPGPAFQVTFADGSVDPGDRLLTDADVIVVWSAALDSDRIEQLRNAKLIQKIGVGLDKIDLAAAERRGIPVVNTPGVNAVSCAELTIMLILACLRRLTAAHRATAAGRWEKWQVRANTRELMGKQVGLVGLGQIGSLVARYVAAFGAVPVYYTPRRRDAETERALGVGYLPLPDLLATSDVVSVHAPLTETTRGLLGARQLSAMKPGAVLVNTARGEIVDSVALCEALRSGALLGAGLDVFPHEPPETDDPLLSLDNVILTPHIGGVTEDSRARLIRQAGCNVRRVLAATSPGHAGQEPAVASDGVRSSVGFRVFGRAAVPVDDFGLLGRHSSSVLADAMHGHGCLDPRIRPVNPGMSRFAGPALTVSVSPGNGMMIRAAMRLARPGDVLVVNAHGIVTRAVFGDNVAADLQRHGVIAAVVDGAVRDAARLRELGFPVFARAVTPRSGSDASGRGEVLGPVACGSCAVMPGDAVIADEDGVVVVPAADAAEVLRALSRAQAGTCHDVQTYDASRAERSLLDQGCRLVGAPWRRGEPAADDL